MTNSKITFVFPHPELTLIEGCPTPLSLTRIFSEVYDNAMSVPSNMGSGGHLGAIMPAAKYLALLDAIAYNYPFIPVNKLLLLPMPPPSRSLKLTKPTTQLWNASLHITMSSWHSNR
jgi:hypothetical protein